MADETAHPAVDDDRLALVLSLPPDEWSDAWLVLQRCKRTYKAEIGPFDRMFNRAMKYNRISRGETEARQRRKLPAHAVRTTDTESCLEPERREERSVASNLVRALCRNVSATVGSAVHAYAREQSIKREMAQSGRTVGAIKGSRMSARKAASRLLGNQKCV